MQKVNVANARLLNLFALEFNSEFYDTVLATTPPDPALTKFKQFYRGISTMQDTSKMTSVMLENIENGKHFALVDGFVAGCHDRYYCWNSEGLHAQFGVLSLVQFGLPYMRLFRGSLLESMTTEPHSPLSRRFRMFVEHRLMPAMAELAEILYESGTLLEWPSTEEMRQLFPYVPAENTREMMMFNYRSYFQSWCAVLCGHFISGHRRLTRGTTPPGRQS